jgi:hypothetical protein
MKKLLLTILGAGMITASITANAELVQQFKDPTFSGNGWASQVLTLEQMRNSAQNSLDSKAASEAAAAAAATTNTPLAKFMALFTGQVYSQLATQLTNNLFKDCTGSACSSGSFMVTDTQQIQWVKASGQVTLTVYDGKKVNDIFVPNSAYTQQIVVPISSFSF